MPRPDYIYIHTHDLQKIMDVLEAQQITGCHIKLTTLQDHISIRDTSDFNIGMINKTKPEPHETTKKR